MSGEWLFGRQAVREALRAGRRTFHRALVSEGSTEQGSLADILTECKRRRLAVEKKPRAELDRLGDGHQGVAVFADAYPYVPLADLISEKRDPAVAPLYLILDLIQDPQNLGTLLRTAEAVGVQGVILPLRRTALVTPAVVNASAGACEHLRVAQANLAQAIEALKREEVWIGGLESSPRAVPIFDADLSMPLALVVGSEAEGLRQLVRESCDWLFSLPMRGRVESLNAAVAGSIALYLAYQARGRSSPSPEKL